MITFIGLKVKKELPSFEKQQSISIRNTGNYCPHSLMSGDELGLSRPSYSAFN